MFNSYCYFIVNYNTCIGRNGKLIRKKINCLGIIVQIGAGSGHAKFAEVDFIYTQRATSSTQAEAQIFSFMSPRIYGTSR